MLAPYLLAAVRLARRHDLLPVRYTASSPRWRLGVRVTARVDTQAERELRDALIAAVNGNPISADDAWALIHAWDDRADRDAKAGLLADAETALRRIDAIEASDNPNYGVIAVIARKAVAAFDAAGGAEACEHEWVSARNEAVTSGLICRICHALAPEPSA